MEDMNNYRDKVENGPCQDERRKWAEVGRTLLIPYGLK